MNETMSTNGRGRLLAGSREDLEAGVLPRVPEYPASNYTYAKRAEAMRGEAEAGRTAQLCALIQLVTGSNTYARMTRLYGHLLLEHLDRAAAMAAAVEAAEAAIAEAAEAVAPKKAVKKKAAAKEVA